MRCYMGCNPIVKRNRFQGLGLSDVVMYNTIAGNIYNNFNDDLL